MSDADDLTMSPAERSLWVKLEASVSESHSRSGGVATRARRRTWRFVGRSRSRLPWAWLSLASGAALTVGTFTRSLPVAMIGVAVQGAAVSTLVRPVSRGLASLPGRTGRAVRWFDLTKRS